MTRVRHDLPRTLTAAARALRRGDVARDRSRRREPRRHRRPPARAPTRSPSSTRTPRAAEARRADDERASGIDRGPLHGLPICLKDLIDVRGQVTTAGSRVLRDRVADADAPLVTRLREAGAIVIGRTNLHEFALGTTSEDSAFGPVRNPFDADRVAGGSSGGSAAAVATGMGLASIGTDTGGSIRIPAAACGIVGLKPTFGEVPTDGVIPLSPSFDHVGPLTVDVEDAAVLWAVLAGRPVPRLDGPRPERLRLADLNGYFRCARRAGSPERVRRCHAHARARRRDVAAPDAPGCGAHRRGVSEHRAVRGREVAWPAPRSSRRRLQPGRAHTARERPVDSGSGV